jgi:hypothetical protein
MSPFSVELDLVVNWENDGSEIRSVVNPKTQRIASRPQNTDYYFRWGITWPARPWLRGAFSVVPEGVIFTHTGMMLFVKREEVWSTVALLNSDAFVGLLHLLMARGSGSETDQTLKYELGYLSSVPLPSVDSTSHQRLTELGKQGYELFSAFASHVETGHRFLRPARFESEARSLRAVVPQLCADYARNIEKRRALLDDINSIAYEQYTINKSDREKLREGLGRDLADSARIDEGEEDGSSEEALCDARTLTTSWLSYCVGVVYGRWDVRKADEPASTQSDPLATLPIYSPGMLSFSSAYLTKGVPEGYPSWTSQDGILADDPDHADDMVRRVRGVLELILKDRAEAIEKEGCELL